MENIKVDHLVKSFKVSQKDPGLMGSLRSFVKRTYKVVEAVHDVSFEIEAGELIGFIGPNGAGKTTTLKCLSGLLYPTSGVVNVLGYKPFERKAKFLKQISLVMGQKNQLWWDLPATDTFLLNKEIYEISDEQYKKTTQELFDLLDVQEFIQTPVRNLSLGQRMKCELIASLIHTPKILFLDEPTIGLDVVMQKNLRDFIKDYNQKNNATIILTSHYMDDVKELCKRIIVIDHGQVIYDGLLADIIKKFTTKKSINVQFNKPVEKSSLIQFGNVKTFNHLTALIEVENARSNQIVAKILDEFPVEDLTIQDPEIEDIIREVFNKNNE